MKSILLQCKFLLVEWLNITYQLVPDPLRNYYLRFYGIKIGGGISHLFTENVNSFTLGIYQ